jgi:hypothetical protein
MQGEQERSIYRQTEMQRHKLQAVQTAFFAADLEIPQMEAKHSLVPVKTM